jgi:hypothetical protein
MKMKKSTRHPKITGDFAEGLVLYWLSKYGHESARIDHTGIDLIARNRSHAKPMGISVKSRSRYKGTEGVDINLPPDGFEKAIKACRAFNCEPYYAIVVDGADFIRCFVLSLAHLKKLVRRGPKMWHWRMTTEWLAKYQVDPEIMKFELETVACSWQGKTIPTRA